MHGREVRLLLAVLLLGTGACTTQTPPSAEPQEVVATAAGAAFDAADTGTIEGRVTWTAPLPHVPPLKMQAGGDNLPPDGRRLFYRANPFEPLIDIADRGVADVVVFLRTVDPGRARGWHHGTARVEQVDRTIRVRQDGASSRVGFVRRGDGVEAVNHDGEFHSLRARGAAFFTLPFVTAGPVSTRRLEQAGVVELSSGAGYCWMRANLFVVEHPYYTRTDRAGGFRLEQVPAGQYEVVCWMPSWVVTRRERDPECSFMSRLDFAAALEQSATVAVRAGTTADATFVWRAAPEAGTQ